MIELTFLKVLMLIKQVNQKNVTIGIFQIKGLSFNSMSAQVYDVLSMNLRDIAILNIINADYGCITSGISKSEAVNLLKNADLTEKSKTL